MNGVVPLGFYKSFQLCFLFGESYVSGFHLFCNVLHHFVLGKLSTSRIRVNHVFPCPTQMSLPGPEGVT